VKNKKNNSIHEIAFRKIGSKNFDLLFDRNEYYPMKGEIPSLLSRCFPAILARVIESSGKKKYTKTLNDATKKCVSMQPRPAKAPILVSSFSENLDLHPLPTEKVILVQTLCRGEDIQPLSTKVSLLVALSAIIIMLLMLRDHQ